MSLGGGMAVQRPVAERWLKMTGTAVTEGYGLSETSPVATAKRHDQRREIELGEIGIVHQRIEQRVEAGEDVHLRFFEFL
ncbi:AMP-binding protein, partial [Rhizobium johnstonii]|uniref:AMP-binding protein n=1 Tax=Rhizobium johnstonii TaxID=3019933 RepID=UPI003F9949E9